jgi:hypothetical protein
LHCALSTRSKETRLRDLTFQTAASPLPTVAIAPALILSGGLPTAQLEISIAPCRCP